MMLTISPAAATALQKLNNAGFPAYAVGGCVRDMLRGAVPGDFDVTTAAQPTETETVFKGFRVIETGMKHGTVTVLIDGEPIEITTYRLENTYSDHRHPDAVRFTDRLDDDLARRDFTVNAMALDREGRLTDLFGGQQDLKDGIIRCVGDPATRFREDALRILRALRFAAVLGFSIEPNTAAAIRSELPLLRYVSAERVFTELKKLLCGKYAGTVLTEYRDVLTYLIPELRQMPGFQQNNPHHCYDVWTHTVKAVEATPNEPILRLAALFHDSGKPAVYTEDAEGIGHFHGHAEVSEQLADAFFLRMKADGETRDTVLKLVKMHDRVLLPDEKQVRRLLGKLGETDFFRLLALQRADNLAQHADYRDRQQEFDRIEAIARELLQKDACFSLKQLAVNGRDLIEAGIPAGPAVGAWLDALLQAVIDGVLPNEQEILLAAVARKQTFLNTDSETEEP